ncbi:MAG: FHA domain-containing protein, partial [Polyangiaceae bacterium]
MAKVALTFALYQNDQLVRRDTIAQDIVKVGKDARSHLRVDDDAASRMHAVIEVASPSDITLIDLGNEPGTLVNAQRVNKCKVRPGDQIQIGSTLIVLEAAEPAGAQAAAAPPPPPAAAAAPANPFGGANPFAGPAAPANPFAGAPAAAANPFAASNPFAGSPAAPAAAGFAPSAGGGYAAASAPLEPTPGLGIEPPLEGATGLTYAMVKAGPDVLPDEVEVAHASAIEVMILWESNVLHVSHLAPPRSYFVGEEMGDKIGCDYFIPSETLGTTRAPIVVSRGLGAALTILPRSRGYVDIPGQGKVSLADLITTGRARASSEMSGAHEYELPAGAKARMEIEGSALVFQVSAVNAGKKIPHGMLATMEPAAFLFTGLSFLLHMGLVAVFAFFMPNMGGDDSEDIDRDQILMMQKLLNAAAEREQEQQDAPVTETQADQKEGGTGTRAKGEEGSMGNPNTKDSGHKYGVQGPKDNPDPHLAKQAALQEAAQFGMIGLISTMGGGDPNAPTAPWGREESSGADEKSARGNMFGDTIG